MKRNYIILLLACLFSMGLVQAQVRFETLVTRGPVVVGESFRVQYIMEVISPDDEFIAPEFKFFRINDRPAEFPSTGNATSGMQKLRNITFVLTPMREGNLLVPGAKAIINGKPYTSPHAFIQVISKEKAEALTRKQRSLSDINPNIYLSPGENPEEKIRNGLYMKVSVDRPTCYVGQPVTATFKLYSRLHSKSDIIKNPGLYGFTVQEMVGLKDKIVHTEEINGRKYDVHTVRQVQLYPLHAGDFEIDAMEVRSKVRFSKSAVNMETEQVIAEGVYEDAELIPNENWVEYEHHMRSAPVKVAVRPLPEKGKPKLWTGAVGKFTIKLQLAEGSLAANEEGHLQLTINGKGNFTQLVAPLIDWPAGLEGFEARAEDQLDVAKVPMQGSRRFIYPFVASHTGDYTISPLTFTFFNPDSNKYITLQTDTISFTISTEKKKEALSENAAGELKKPGRSNPAGLYLVVIVAMVIVGAVFTWRRETRKEKIQAQLIPQPAIYKLQPEEALKPAAIMLGAEDRSFYAALHQGIWNYLSERLHLSGTQMNKIVVQQALLGRITEADLQELNTLVQSCEIGLFTDADAGYDKESLLASANRLLQKIDEFI